MPSDLVVNLALMTCHDFLFYASQDYGAMARPADVLGNYALMYAINRRTPEVRRLTSGNTPHYDEDLPRMPVYATPGAFVEDFPQYQTASLSRRLTRQIQLGGTLDEQWHTSAPVMLTWNSIGASLLDKMAQDSMNMPKVGAYYKHPPLASFYFYTVGSPVPSVLRIGKKYIPARVRVQPLVMEEKTGVFQPTCPVTVADLPEETKIRSGSILTMPPSPVLLLSELEGAYLDGKDSEGLIHRFPVPRTTRYSAAWGRREEE